MSTTSIRKIGDTTVIERYSESCIGAKTDTTMIQKIGDDMVINKSSSYELRSKRYKLD